MKKKKRRYSIRIKMMGINSFIVLISFLLCGSLFVGSVSILIRKYINSDMDFFLTELTDNLSEKFEYMEKNISEIRTSSILMSYLTSDVEIDDKQEIKKEFSHLIDINNLDNQRNDWKPIIEEVYLLRMDASYIADYYYMLVSDEIQENYQEVYGLWSEFAKERAHIPGFESKVVIRDGSIYVLCPILDDKLAMCGTAIYKLNQMSLQSIMTELGNYDHGFWIMFDKEQNVLDGQFEKNPEEALCHLYEPEKVPYSCELYGESYRLYHRELGVDVYLLLGIPENHAEKILYESLDIYVVMIATVLLVGLISFAIFTYKITKPLEDVSQKLRSVQAGDFHTKMPEYEEKEFYEISNGFNHMTSEINHLITEVYEKKILLKELELKFLQSQLNPHFIFNVLNAISLQANIDGNKQLGQTISTFSKLIQAKIYRSDLEKVKIRQELEYAQYYLQIQEFRFGNRITYSIDVDEGLMEYYIQKLCIQLIVENAVIHGLEPKVCGGTVCIRGYKDGQDIIIEIQDDGVGFESNDTLELPLKKTNSGSTHNQVGLNNIHAILQLRYGKQYGLTITSKRNEGTTVKIRIPFDDGME